MKKALATGIIDCISTDHAPHTPAEKAAGYEAAPFGVIGLETSWGVVLTELYHTGMMSLPQIITAMSVKPRKLLSLPEVRLAEGYPADISLFDPDLEWPVNPQRFFSKSRNCPFAGRLLKGRPIATIVAGRFAMKHGQII
jgi:dihydroorotase